MVKMRADQLLVAQGLCDSRERAKTSILAGLVYQADRKVEKPGQLLEESTSLTVRGDPIGFVSRGGLKLQKALDVFSLSPEGLTALDAGASTGGFTDCLLQRGAKHVWAVDVGSNQLAAKLREDARITLLEGTNIRNLTSELLGVTPQLVVADLSFISLKLVLPVLHRLTAPDAWGVCLVKPQFEAGREQVGKRGVVRSPAVHQAVLRAFVEHAGEVGWSVVALDFSPVCGPEGNIEYLAHLSKTASNGQHTIEALVQTAHKATTHKTLDGDR